MAVSIVKCIKDEFLLDNEALYRILNNKKLENKSVCIVSIAGSFRTGKSFLLNFFVRYLTQRGWENTNWVGNSSKKVADGFNWSRGQQAHTSGITIWPEPFIVNYRGKEIAYLLLDSQGLFDSDTSPDMNAKIMAMSTLLSTHQILNVQNKIEERDLEHLQFCVSYAKEAKRRAGTALRGITPFQSLTFLIRDWVNDYENAFGSDGGAEYLQNFLMAQSRSREVNDIKQSIKAGFARTNCFLMPHPGLRIPSMHNDQVTNGAIESNFLEMVQRLSDHVLNPGRAVCMSEGITDRINLVLAVGKSFNGNEAPRVETALKSYIRSVNTSSLQAAVKAYEDSMEKGMDRITSASGLDRKHQEALGQAKKVFQAKAHHADGLNMEGYNTKLDQECRYKFERIKRQFDLAQEMKEATRKEQMEKEQVREKLEVQITLSGYSEALDKELDKAHVTADVLRELLRLKQQEVEQLPLSRENKAALVKGLEEATNRAIERSEGVKDYREASVTKSSTIGDKILGTLSSIALVAAGALYIFGSLVGAGVSKLFRAWKK